MTIHKKKKLNLKKKLSNLHFNWYAFVFNSLYYLVKGLPLYFCFYALAPWVLIMPATAFIKSSPAMFWILSGSALLIVRIISGCMAHHHLEELKKTAKKINFEAPTEYLAISRKRLFFLSLLSGGWYLIYWMYKNWNAVRNATKEPILPIFRSYFFTIFFIYPLFLRIKTSAKKYKSVGRGFAVCSVLVVFFWLLNSLIDLKAAEADWETFSVFDLAAIIFLTFTTVLAISLLFLPIQNELNAYNQKEFPARGLKQKFTWGETVITLVGFIAEYAIFVLYILMALGNQSAMPNLQKLPQNQQIAIIQTIGTAYRNIHGYAAVCAQSGYELKNYPEEFKKSMDSELDGLEQILMRDNVSLEKSFDIFVQGDILKQIHEELYNELKIIAAPDDDGVSSACQLLDTDAADIAQNVSDEIRPFYYETLVPLFRE